MMIRHRKFKIKTSYDLMFETVQFEKVTGCYNFRFFFNIKNHSSYFNETLYVQNFNYQNNSSDYRNF